MPARWASVPLPVQHTRLWVAGMRNVPSKARLSAVNHHLSAQPWACTNNKLQSGERQLGSLGQCHIALQHKVTQQKSRRRQAQSVSG